MWQTSSTRRSTSGGSLAWAVVLVAGASVFAYLFGVAVHEIGHYLASLILGVPEPGIVLHPFDLSQNIYGGDPFGNAGLGTPLRRAISGAAGPLLNLLLGVTVSLVLWPRRSSRWLPLLMWGGIALVVESVGMIIGLFDYPEVGSDWSDVMAAGVPPLVIGLLVVALILAGSLWLLLLLPLTGFSAEDRIWKKVLAFLAGIPLLLFGAVVYLTLLGSYGDSFSAPYVLQNRQIALAASVALVAVIGLVHRPLFPFLDRVSHTPVARITRRDASVAAGLCAAVFVLQLVFFSYPAALKGIEFVRINGGEFVCEDTDAGQECYRYTEGSPQQSMLGSPVYYCNSHGCSPADYP